MSSYRLLSKEIREYIYDQGWPALTKIQEASIKYAKDTDANLILCAPTASGKTEAAFLPAIDHAGDFNRIPILYISPLVALINDQFRRLNGLCDQLKISSFIWHNEVSQSRKKALLADPKGILLITPESIEAILTMHPEYAAILFSDVRWILVDEIHSFIGNDRGYQLRSLLERIKRYMHTDPRYIGMSATLGKKDMEAVKQFFPSDRNTLVLADRTKKELEYKLEFVEPSGDFKWDFERVTEKIYERSKRHSSLLFANSRHTVEDFASRLKKWGANDNVPVSYFAHYSNLSKELKRSAELFAKEEGLPFLICCTSTLELGIDIGAVDEVIQYDAPMSVSSLAQRAGRSGRRNTPSQLYMISSEPWLFLQAYAALMLLKKGELDSVLLISRPYNVFVHQVLSILLERGSMPFDEFKNLNHSMRVWQWVKDAERSAILNYLLKQELIELCGGDVIAGREMEKLLKNGSFFSLFEGEDSYVVYYGSEKLAEVVPPPWMKKTSLILIASKAWEVVRMDSRKKRIDVIPAEDGRSLKLGIPGIIVSDAIRQEMKTIMERPEQYPDSRLLEKVIGKRKTSSLIKDEEGQLVLQTFRGTKIDHTLMLLLMITAHTDALRCSEWDASLYFTNSHFNMRKELERCMKTEWDRETIFSFLKNDPERVEAFLAKTKYRDLLPPSVRIDYVIDNLLDIEGTKEYLGTLELNRG